MVSKASHQSFLDPTSGSFKASSPFEVSSQSHSSRHNSDETNRRAVNSIVFGSSDIGFSSQAGRSTLNTTAGFSGYNSSAASRSGSLPPSRNGADQQTQFNEDFPVTSHHSQLSQVSNYSHRPNLSANTSGYATQVGNQRYGDQMYPTQLGDLAANFAKVNLSKENEQLPFQPQNDSYYDYTPQMGHGSTNATWEPEDNGYQGNPGSYGPDGRQLDSLAPSSNQYRGVQYGGRASHSPSGSDARRSHDSPLYSTGGTPPLAEHHRASSNRNARANLPNGQAAMLERKLRGLQQEQQAYVAPQLNPLQFRAPYAHPYDYSAQNMLRMNPLAQYYPMPGLAGYPTNRMVPRGPMLDSNSGENLRSNLLEEFRSNSKGNKRYELKVQAALSRS